MPIRTNGGVFNDQMLTGSLSHWVVTGADFSGAVDQYGQPVPFSAAEIIFKNIESGAYINIMNPNELNLSFALEEGRSKWTAESLQEMIRGLGTDVGVDHLDLSGVVVTQVPYIFGVGSGGASSFLELTDTPGSYEGSAGYIVTVAPGEDGLIFTDPSTIIPPPGTQNAYSFVEVPSQPTLTAVGEDTLTIIPGENITLTTDAATNTLTIGFIKTGIYSFVPAGGGETLTIDNRYFLTSNGTVTLPALTSSYTVGQALSMTKRTDVTATIVIGDASDIINTDLGPTDSIIFDATDQLIFVVSSENSWELQIGAATT